MASLATSVGAEPSVRFAIDYAEEQPKISDACKNFLAYRIAQAKTDANPALTTAPKSRKEHQQLHIGVHGHTQRSAACPPRDGGQPCPPRKLEFIRFAQRFTSSSISLEAARQRRGEPAGARSSLLEKPLP